MTAVPLLAAVDEALAQHFGMRPQRASVSFLGVDPIEVLRFEVDGGSRCYVSLGMSRHPMSGADASVLDAAGPRAELSVRLRDPGNVAGDVWRSLAVLAAAPIVEGVVYRPGMTLDLGQPLVTRSACTGVVISASAIASVSTAEGTVEVLDAVPATSTELAWARVHGTPALLTRWAQARVDLLDPYRRPVSLD